MELIAPFTISPVFARQPNGTIVMTGELLDGNSQPVQSFANTFPNNTPYVEAVAWLGNAVNKFLAGIVATPDFGWDNPIPTFTFVVPATWEILPQ